MRIALLVLVLVACGGAEPVKDSLCASCQIADGRSAKCCDDPGADPHSDHAMACTWNTGDRINPESKRTPQQGPCDLGAQEVCRVLTDGSMLEMGCKDPYAFECYAHHGTENPACCYDPKATGWDGRLFHLNNGVPPYLPNRGSEQANCCGPDACP